MDSRTLLFTFLIFTNLTVLVRTYYRDYLQSCLNDGNYTSNSTYSTNLNTLLSSLPSNIGDTGFYNASLGQNDDRIYASAFCRGDLQLDECRLCVKDGTDYLFNNCPNRRRAIVWVDICMVRYSDESFFGIRNADIGAEWYDIYNVTSPEKYNEELAKLVVDLLNQASGGTLMKYAAGNRTAPDFQIIFAALQCTPDISKPECVICLWACAQKISTCCKNSRAALILAPSCNLRYGFTLFYNITRYEEVLEIHSRSKVAPVPMPTTVPVPTPVPAPQEDDHNITRTVILVVVPIISSLIILVFFGCWIIRRMKRKPDDALASGNDFSAAESLRYELNQIREATNNFSADNVLGRGGFGVVYKGKLQNGQEIAVKRLIGGSAQGDVEFQNEVMLLAKLQHRNLVRLVGFAQEEKERILIYEFIQNTSLDHFIFDPTKAHYIDWNRRFKIIGGIAKGLLYLHEDSRLRIIHRDLKPSNILLDKDMNPKIADFGMARLCKHDENEANTSRIAGTFGYMAPEYIINGHFSVKSDVFSFGVIVLEIIMGQKNTSLKIGDSIVQEGLLNFAWKNWREGTITNLMDPILQSTLGSVSEITRCVHIALLCIQENVSDRPTMASVVLMLSSSTVTLPLPSKPAFFVAHTADANSSSLNDADSRNDESSQSTNAMLPDPKPLSRNDISVSELYPR